MLEVEVAGIKMRNPVMLASGICDLTKESMEKFSSAGAIVTKSVGIEKRAGYKNPVFCETECGILNAIGLSNPGVDEYIKEINEIKIENLIASIFGKDESEFYKVAKKISPYVKAIEMNMSCPHAKKVGMEYPSDEINSAVENVKKTGKPVFVKLGMENILRRAENAIEGGADAIVAINSVKAMKICIDFAEPILGNKIGGYSGKGIKPIGVRCVYEISQNFDLPVIGVGGIMNAEDVIEYMMAGANAVQIGSLIYYEEKPFAKICKNLEEWLDKNGYSSINDIVGIALKK
ncbi:MAG TPA: dihydroorotate dehydrogenase [Thermoplasmatales archaeon]|nr:dihydroorotate dehydrogenase [Thermoplasmatales archaeon]